MPESQHQKSLAPAWRQAPAQPSILPGELHVWRLDLDWLEGQNQSRLGLLSADELQRANRFIFQQHRERFVAARAALRCILAGYLQIDASTLRFGYASHGKPYIPLPDNPHDLRFNLSHSGGVALLALAVGIEVGVDIERIQTDFLYLEIAQQFFTAVEYAALSATDSVQQCETFFKYWTHKEAFIKATGVGLSLPPQQLEVSLQPDTPCQLLHAACPPPDHVLLALTPCAGHVGAVAVMGTYSQIQLWVDGVGD